MAGQCGKRFSSTNLVREAAPKDELVMNMERVLRNLTAIAYCVKHGLSKAEVSTGTSRLARRMRVCWSAFSIQRRGVPWTTVIRGPDSCSRRSR